MFKVEQILALIAVYLISGILSFDDDRIFGDQLAKEAEFPYQVSIRSSYNNEHFCGGSIISPRHIITAAHCMTTENGKYVSPNDVFMVAGQNVLTINQNTVLQQASKIYVHEEYDYGTKKNDIAIIEVSEDLSLGDNIDIASMRRNKIKPGSKCTISGWGYQGPGSKKPSEKLRRAEIKVIDFKKCQDVYATHGSRLYPGMMCAGVPDGSKDACLGDSGGPLFCNELLTGIVSFGPECGTTTIPGVYTDISDYIPWITEKIEEKTFYPKKVFYVSMFIFCICVFLIKSR